MAERSFSFAQWHHKKEISTQFPYMRRVVVAVLLVLRNSVTPEFFLKSVNYELIVDTH